LRPAVVAQLRAGMILSLALVMPVAAGKALASAPAPARPAAPSNPTQTTQVPGGADDWAAKARAHQKAGSIFEALDAFDKACAIEPSRADIRLEYADLLRTAGFWLRGASEYEKVLELKPTSVDARLGYGELLQAEYQFTPAARQFSDALRLNPEPLDREHATLGLGTSQYFMEDYPAAARTFASVMATNPKSVTAIAYLALTTQRMGDLDEALRLWTQLLEIQPNVARTKIHRIEIEELRAAIEQARSNVQREPSNAAAWANLGRLLRRKPDLPGAIEAYAAAARIAPSDSSYRFGLGVLQRDAGRWRDAAESFQAVGAAGKESPQAVLALYNLAYCATRAGNRKLESTAWSDAVALNPHDMYAYRRYARSLVSTPNLQRELASAREAAGRLDAAAPADVTPLLRLAILNETAQDRPAARRAALAALSLDLNDVSAQKLLRDLMALDPQAVSEAMKEAHGAPNGSASRVAVLMMLSRGKEAESDLRAMLAAAPKDTRLMVALAYCVKQAGRLDEAVSLLNAAREAGPGYLYAHLDLGLAMLESNHLDEAIAAAREAVRLAPGNPVGYTLLGSALNEKGDYEKAARALERAVAIDPMDDQGAPRLMLAKVYGAMKLNDEARDILKGDLPEEPSEIYAIAWRFVRDTYADRGFRGQDWREWEHRFDGKLRSTPEALGAVARMLGSLNDRNTRLRSLEQTANLLFTQRTDAPEFSRVTGAALSSSKTVESRRLDDNTGYIAITNLYDPKLPGEIQKAVEQMKTSDGVILDLRGNQGGSDGDVPRITGMFVPPGTATGTVVGPEGTVKSKAEPATADGKPILPKDKPLVVLVDRNTASSAENLAGSLKESHRAVLVGEKTYGKSGIQVPRLLPGGAIVLVVGAEHADLKGAIYTGVGIRPDVTVEGANTGDRTADDPSVKKAREILRQKKPGS